MWRLIVTHSTRTESAALTAAATRPSIPAPVYSLAPLPCRESLNRIPQLRWCSSDQRPRSRLRTCAPFLCPKFLLRKESVQSRCPVLGRWPTWLRICYRPSERRHCTSINQGVPRNAYVRMIDVSDRLWQRFAARAARCSTASIHMHVNLRGGATVRQLRSLLLALTCAGQLEFQLSSDRPPAGPSRTDAIEFMLLLHDLIQERF